MTDAGGESESDADETTRVDEHGADDASTGTDAGETVDGDGENDASGTGADGACASGAAEASCGTDTSEASDASTDEPADADDGETLAERVAAHDERLGERIAELETALEETENRADQLESQLARTKADFENYKDRAERKRERIRERATEDLVERLTEVRNNLVRALDQDGDADIRPGVESTLETFDRVLSEEGVETIDPEPGSEVDPSRHRVMMRVESDQPEGTIADVYQPGYEMGGSVIEAARVTVSDGE